MACQESAVRSFPLRFFIGAPQPVLKLALSQSPAAGSKKSSAQHPAESAISKPMTFSQ
jgi:hypothetical protein